MVSKLTSQGTTFSTFRVSGPERQHPRLGIGVALEDAVDDGHESRMTGEHQTGARRLQGLGDVPGETDVVADAGHQRHLAAQVQGNHADPHCKGNDLRHPPECESSPARVCLANRQKRGKMNLHT